MRVIIAGSRTVKDYRIVEKAVQESGFTPSVILSGCQKNWDSWLCVWYGVDHFGECWAKSRGIPVEFHPAEWTRYGHGAGPIRNGEMARCADALIAVWDGKSRGTSNMIGHAERRGLRIFVYRIALNPSDSPA